MLIDNINTQNRLIVASRSNFPSDIWIRAMQGQWKPRRRGDTESVDMNTFGRSIHRSQPGGYQYAVVNIKERERRAVILASLGFVGVAELAVVQPR